MCSYKMNVDTHAEACKLLLTENFETKAGVDLGTKYKNAGTLYKKKFDAPGRALDLEALWREKGSEVELAAVYKLDTQKKATVKYVSLTESCAPPANMWCAHTADIHLVLRTMPARAGQHCIKVAGMSISFMLGTALCCWSHPGVQHRLTKHRCIMSRGINGYAQHGRSSM